MPGDLHRSSGERYPFQVSKPPKETDYLRSPNLDETAIIRSILEMPTYGGARGIIPAFDVYLATMPAMFYCLVC